MGKYDFWPVQCFLNGQKWGLKTKAYPYVHFEGLKLTLILAKYDPLGAAHIDKKGFFHILLMRE